jgi:hypothetical protein
MAARLDVELMTSTAASAMTMVVIIHRSLIGRAIMLPSWQFSFGQCPNHQLWRGGKPTRSCVPFSNVPRCSRLKALRLDGVGPSSTSLHHWWHMRREPRSTRNNRKWGISPHLSMPALATTTTRVMSSMRAKGTRRMVLAVVTTLARAATTTVERTEAHRPNPRDRGSLAKTSVTRRSRHGFGNLSTSPSTLGRQTSSSGLTTTASPAN